MNNREKKLLNRRPPAPTTVGTPTTVVTHQKTLNTNPSSSSSPSSCVHDDQKLVKQPSFSLTQSLQHILKDADSPIDKSSEHKLYDQLYSGIFLHHKTQKYWMNKKSNSNCFILYARALSITWADNENYWRWVSLEESNGTMIEVAELERVCWLEVHGRLDTRKFSPGILYEVSFHVMLKDTAQGWEVPINMRLVLPGGKIKQEHKENLKDKMRGSWMDIPVGQFIASDHGEIEFSMYEYDGGIWKSGLLIKGVSIKPNSDDYKLLKQPSLSLVQSLQHILKDADSPIDKSSEQKLYDQLYSGIFLHHKTQMYWMNKKSNNNCFMLYARALSITWVDTEKYWRWVSLEESNGAMMEVAELEKVCWLEVHGRLDTRKLSPGILYEVSFHVMLKHTAQGWEVPINMRLVLPGGKIKQEHKENLKDKMRGSWMDIPVGQFIASDHGEIEFSMYEYDGGIWKSGLLIKGVSIKPNSDDYKLMKQPSLSFTQSLQDILKNADSPIDKSSEHKIYDQLYSGIFLHHKTQKYWMNKKSNSNCFMFYARALSISWADNEKYWRWVSLEESNGTMIEVAELERVCWLEVHGRLDTRKLSPGILYEVSFHVMLKDRTQGWEVPINMRLFLPGGKIKQEHKENLKDKVRGRWMEIPVGQFIASNHGEIEFSMYEYDGGIWKSGLLIKGVSIKPNFDNYKLAL